MVTMTVKPNQLQNIKHARKYNPLQTENRRS